MKKIQLIMLLSLMLILQNLALCQSTESQSKNENCFEMWKVPCNNSQKITEYIAKYPILEKENTVLTNLLNSNNELYKAEKDSINAVFSKELKKVKYSAKKARFWGNIKPLTLMIGFVAILIKR
jgi:hypothetical protein